MKRPMLESFTVRNEHGFIAVQVDANGLIVARFFNPHSGDQTVTFPRSMLHVFNKALNLLAEEVI